MNIGSELIRSTLWSGPVTIVSDESLNRLINVHGAGV